MVTVETSPINTRPIIYLSDKRTLFVGYFNHVLVQTHAASTLVLSLESDLSLMDANGEVVTQSRCVLLPAGIELSMDVQGSKVLVCFLDALGVDLAILSRRMQKTLQVNGMICYYDIEDANQLDVQALAWFDMRPSARQVFEWIDQWIGRAESGLKVLSDERIARAVELIKQNYSKNDAIDDLARTLCLSVPRLAQLFRKITGIPIRRYRLWHRIYVTVLGVSRGLPLNEAALRAGFSDYAHFSRAFKSIGGINPSEILSGPGGMDIRVLDPD